MLRERNFARDASRSQGPTVYIVDDDPHVQDALRELFQSVGLHVIALGSARDLLKADLAAVESCLVLDVRLPGLSGLDLQAEMNKAQISIPIVFMTGHGDIPMTVRAMKGGAIDFLTKPFRDQDLLDAVAKALEHDHRRREKAKTTSELGAHFGSLTPREQQIMTLITAGLMNKQAAAKMGLSEITIKKYRGNVMKKMGARSLADLVKMAEALKLQAADE
jgi:FixJ family two-component response regulator